MVLGGVTAHVEMYCKQYQRCKIAIAYIQDPTGNLLASKPFEIMALDFTLLERDRKNFENVFLITCFFHSLLLLIPLEIRKVPLLLWHRWEIKFRISVFFRGYTVTRVDNLNQMFFFPGNLQIYGVKKSRITACNSREAGLADRFNKIFFELLK